MERLFNAIQKIFANCNAMKNAENKRKIPHKNIVSGFRILHILF